MSSLTPDSLQELLKLIPKSVVDLDPAALLRASRDYYWMSPILKRKLADRPPAEILAKPESEDHLQTILKWAYRNNIPVTPRGKGTGNYGQAVPIDGGLVLDLTNLNAIRSIEENWITAQAGCNFRQLERAASETNQELQLVPSTTGSTLAGFLSGGNGGAGSVTYGMIWNGFVDTLKIYPCTQDSEPFLVQGKDCNPYLHAYGTTGIIAEAKVRLRPRRDWTAFFFSFSPDQIEAVAAASQEIVHLPIPPRLNSFDLPDIVDYFGDDERMPKGRISLRSMVASSMASRIQEIVHKHGGTFEAEDPTALEYLHTHSFNHPTLRIKQKRADLCHLQIKGAGIIKNLPQIIALLPEASCHFDSRKEAGNADSYGGILLSRYESEELLLRAISEIRSMGLQVINVHNHQLGNGHPPSLELIQKTRSKTDPLHLLNDGRIPRSTDS
ncbi:FAD-binding oxidoreductase [Pelagicoccus albus]|uniref:FAD-binding oxidoreductase n=1 Tax=Pelagicoccus albus TaxID=415222 RepID=A0A7X1B926_9BACT|nr:FAD-binding oxidoreductase [Pelagicoccus albus]MBC2607945.1 FAD-binding oxidoreductase [Pelagicoccus albus]